MSECGVFCQQIPKIFQLSKNCDFERKLNKAAPINKLPN